MYDSNQLEAEWTTVGRKKGNRPTQQTKATTIYGVDRAVTAEHLRKDLDKRLKTWRTTSCRRTLLQMLDKNQPDGGWQLDKAVCLATGSFNTINLQLRRRGLMQLACFMDLAKEVGGKEIQLFAQEPNFSEVDKDLLAAYGVTVLPVALKTNSRGYSLPADLGLGLAKAHMSRATLLCNFYMNMEVPALEDFFAHQPGLYLGTPNWDSPRIDTDEDLVVAKGRFERMHVVKKMPVLNEDTTIFGGLMVCWPEQRDEEEEGEGGRG